jgi:hypothetical protein
MLAYGRRSNRYEAKDSSEAHCRLYNLFGSSSTVKFVNRFVTHKSDFVRREIKIVGLKPIWTRYAKCYGSINV